jgi:hypothetical protein
MMHELNEGPHPDPEELMAFADGELAAARQEEVAEWLAAHPEEHVQIDEFHRLTRIWQLTTPPEPAPEAWAGTLVRIESAVSIRNPLQAGGRFRRPVWTFSGLVAAAAVLGVVVLGRSLGPVPTSTTGESPQDEEAYPVASAHEVNIVRMDARDADALVGHPPLSDSLIFAAAGDVRLLNAQPHFNGRVARMGDGSVPMIVTEPAP